MSGLRGDNYSIIAFEDRGTTLAQAHAWLSEAGLQADASPDAIYVGRAKGPRAMRVFFYPGPTGRQRVQALAARYPAARIPEAADAFFLVAFWDLDGALAERSILELVHKTLLERTGGVLLLAWAPEG